MHLNSILSGFLIGLSGGKYVFHIFKKTCLKGHSTHAVKHSVSSYEISISDITLSDSCLISSRSEPSAQNSSKGYVIFCVGYIAKYVEAFIFRRC